MAFDERPHGEKLHFKRKHSKHHVEPPPPYDVRVSLVVIHPLSHKLSDQPCQLIIPLMRQHVLAGVHIVFSSVIPLDVRPETSETWRIAQMFGAKCYTELNPRITHLVAAKVSDCLFLSCNILTSPLPSLIQRGTQKVDAARRQRGIRIVWVGWFLDSINQWRRQDEAPYLIDPESAAAAEAASPAEQDPNQISSDPEPDADDWDTERVPSATKRKSAEPEGKMSQPGGKGSDTDSTTVGPEIATLELDGQGLDMDGVDWDEINDEVEAAMNESDDEDGDGGSVRSGRSANVSEDEWTDESNSVIRYVAAPQNDDETTTDV